MSFQPPQRLWWFLIIWPSGESYELCNGIGWTRADSHESGPNSLDSDSDSHPVDSGSDSVLRGLGLGPLDSDSHATGLRLGLGLDPLRTRTRLRVTSSDSLQHWVVRVTALKLISFVGSADFTKKKWGCRGYPLKTHQFWPTCKLHYGNFWVMLLKLMFLNSFRLPFF